MTASAATHATAPKSGLGIGLREEHGWRLLAVGRRRLWLKGSLDGESPDELARRVAADLEGYNRFLRDELLSLGCVDHVQTGFALQRVVDRTALPLQQLIQETHAAPRAARRP